MTNPTDTNQASEDKLHELLIEKLNARKRMIEPHDERFVIGFQTKVPGDDVDWQYLDEVIMRFVKDVIRTEKLKLLAEVRERVVGEDEKLVIPDYPKTDDEGEPLYSKRAAKEGRKQVTARYHTRKELRNDQRTELTKLEAEL